MKVKCLCSTIGGSVKPRGAKAWQLAGRVRLTNTQPSDPKSDTPEKTEGKRAMWKVKRLKVCGCQGRVGVSAASNVSSGVGALVYPKRGGVGRCSGLRHLPAAIARNACNFGRN
ncbi:hypothetical protein ERJ75_001318400 [Trypanosoma vivax]|nr:hypothetical protein TRVL_09249 [Trypanosoma vivax]KAH8608312.1 hypothetical protein ERJ75_001318700 [Trypanosoma vivax]KAH8608326.1 hypothetical protein ERJ75_001318400 [Trypanosoma vivax]